MLSNCGVNCVPSLVASLNCASCSVSHIQVKSNEFTGCKKKQYRSYPVIPVNDKSLITFFDEFLTLKVCSPFPTLNSTVRPVLYVNFNMWIF